MPVKRILVTGGCGFIGTHLVREAANRGHELRVLDRVAPGQRIAGVDYVLGDAAERSVARRAIRGIDVVYHLAGIAGIPVCSDEPAEAYHSNLLTTCQVLEAIRAQGLRTKLVFASSSAVYGAAKVPRHGIPETALTAWPLSLYASQKIAAEQMLHVYHQAFGVPCLSLRLFNVFGTGQKPSSPYSGVISRFLHGLKKGEITIHGSGDQTRDFIPVGEVVRAFLACLDVPESRWTARAINIASGRSISVRKLAELAVGNAPRPILVKRLPPRPKDILHSRADIRLARKLLQWAPDFSLSESLAFLWRAERGESEPGASTVRRSA